MLSGDASQKSKVIPAAQRHERGFSNAPAAVYVQGNNPLISLQLPPKPEVSARLEVERGEEMIATGAEGKV